MEGAEALGRVTVAIEVTIRPCIEADLPALEWMGLYTRHREIIRQTFDAQQRGDALMLLGVSAGFPVGQAWIDFARKRNEATACIWAVRTFHPLQGNGIGRCLMNAAETVLRERGIGRAELGVERENRAARRFYERLGWRVVGPLDERLRYRGDNGVTIEETLRHWLMTKQIP